MPLKPPTAASPSRTPTLRDELFAAPVQMAITTQGSTAGASTVTITLFEPRIKPVAGFRLPLQEDRYLRVRVTNKNSLANSTNATIAAAGGATVQETHTSTKDLTLKNCVLTTASGVLTSDNTAPSDGDTVTVGTKVYTAKTTLAGVEGQVLINTTADAFLLNLSRAINHTGTPGTDYVAAAAHPTVSASATVTAHTITLTARTGGTAGNAIATTETSAHLSFGATTLLGGLNSIPGVFVITLTDATAETVTLRIGAPLVGDALADYSVKQDVTHA